MTDVVVLLIIIVLDLEETNISTWKLKMGIIVSISSKILLT